MIPKINQLDIISAIKQIDKKPSNTGRSSTGYDLVFEGKRYPPKLVVSYANSFINGKELSSKVFSGGDETNDFLIKNRFPIEVKATKNPEHFFTSVEMEFSRRCWSPDQQRTIGGLVLSNIYFSQSHNAAKNGGFPANASR